MLKENMEIIVKNYKAYRKFKKLMKVGFVEKREVYGIANAEGKYAITSKCRIDKIIHHYNKSGSERSTFILDDGRVYTEEYLFSNYQEAMKGCKKLNTKEEK